MSEQTIYDLSSVSFFYGEKCVLDGVSFKIQPGCFYGIIGPNGSGKTTLLDLLIKNKIPAQGEIFFNHKSLNRCSRKYLARRVALVPQEYSINFPFSIHEIVLMGRHPHIPRFAQPSNHDLDVVASTMAEIGVDRFGDKFVTQLSGGEKQLVILARALAQDTDVFILDEPTSNLDIKYTLNLFASLKKRVAQLNRTVIAVMHDLNLAAAYADEIIFLKNGRLQAMGPTTDVFSATNIEDVFEVEAQVEFNDFTTANRAALRQRGQS